MGDPWVVSIFFVSFFCFIQFSLLQPSSERTDIDFQFTKSAIEKRAPEYHLAQNALYNYIRESIAIYDKSKKISDKNQVSYYRDEVWIDDDEKIVFRDKDKEIPYEKQTYGIRDKHNIIQEENKNFKGKVRENNFRIGPRLPSQSGKVFLAEFHNYEVAIKENHRGDLFNEWNNIVELRQKTHEDNLKIQHFVKPITIFEDKGDGLWITTEKILGGTLFDWLTDWNDLSEKDKGFYESVKRPKELSFDDRSDISDKLIRMLIHMSNAGYAHRNISPHTILMNPDAETVVPILTEYEKGTFQIIDAKPPDEIDHYVPETYHKFIPFENWLETDKFSLGVLIFWVHHSTSPWSIDKGPQGLQEQSEYMQHPRDYLLKWRHPKDSSRALEIEFIDLFLAASHPYPRQRKGLDEIKRLHQLFYTAHERRNRVLKPGTGEIVTHALEKESQAARKKPADAKEPGGRLH